MITSDFKDDIQFTKTDTGYDVKLTWYEIEERKELHKLLDRMLDNKDSFGILSHCDINGRTQQFRLKLDYDEQRYPY